MFSALQEPIHGEQVSQLSGFVSSRRKWTWLLACNPCGISPPLNIDVRIWANKAKLWKRSQRCGDDVLGFSWGDLLRIGGFG